MLYIAMKIYYRKTEILALKTKTIGKVDEFGIELVINTYTKKEIIIN